MESYGKPATDVFFPKRVRKQYPFLKNVKIECKKKKTVNIFREFTLAKLKYALHPEARLVFAMKRPAPKHWKKHRDKFIKKMGSILGTKRAKKLVRRETFIGGIVAVELDFFKELWNSWKLHHGERKEHEKDLAR